MLRQLLLILLVLPISGIAQHTITASFEPSENYNYIIVYRVEPTKNFYVTDSKKDEQNTFNFVMDSTQVAGIYKVVYGIPQEEKNFDIIYNGKEDIVFTFSETEGITFITSEENKLLVSYEAQMSKLQLDLISEYQAESPDKAKIMVLFKEIERLQTEFEKQASTNLALNFIKANKMYVPPTFEGFNTYVKNRKEHHFDYIDFSNPVLQKSSFLVDNSLGYITGFINPKDALPSYKSNIDDVAMQLKETDVTFQKTFLHTIWSSLLATNLNEAAIYLADNYLLPAAKMDKDIAMVDSVFKVRNLTIGAKAPNFSWTEEENGKKATKSLHDAPAAEQYFLIFWSSGCSHCLQEVPKVHSLVKDIPKEKLRVVAIGLEDDKYNWQNTIMALPAFTHVLGLGKWENEIGRTYNITGTPTYFVLDSKKHIVAKPETLEELLQFVVIDK